jgi:hypothetical protein
MAVTITNNLIRGAGTPPAAGPLGLTGPTATTQASEVPGAQ